MGNQAFFNGTPFWSGSVNLLDGKIEEVHSYKEAEAADFHHTFYFSSSQLEKMAGGECAFFWLGEDGTIKGEWRENLATKSYGRWWNKLHFMKKQIKTGEILCQQTSIFFLPAMHGQARTVCAF